MGRPGVHLHLSTNEKIMINLSSWSNVYPKDGRLSTMKTTGLLQGTLDMLILRTLLFGPAHGHQIAKHIQSTTDDILRLEHGSLYPALHRLERQGWVVAKWEVLGERKRECKYYRLTPAGRKQLAAEESNWNRVAKAIARVMRVPVKV